MNRVRLVVIGAVLFAPLGGLEARLVYLQLVNPDGVIGPAVRRRASLHYAYAPRGAVVDRNGVVLARDERCFDLQVVLEEFEADPGSRTRLESLLSENLQEALDAIYRKIERQMLLRPEPERPIVYRRERRTPYLVRRRISFEQAYAIETAPARYPGCLVKEGLLRVYPLGRTGGAVVGYLGRVSDVKPANGGPSELDRMLAAGDFTEGFEEQVGEDGIALLARRGAFLQELVGRSGVERFHDGRLRGRAGLQILERDPSTGEREWLELVPARAGNELELTLDAELQAAVEEILAQAADECPHPVRAHAVVLDPHNGDVLAIASNVGFDPNDLTPPSKRSVVEAYFQDRRQPLLLHPVRNQFQSGSVFKVITAVAALEEGVASPATTQECAGHYDPRLSMFKCWTVGYGVPPHGPQDVSGALQHSCNVWFFHASEGLGGAGIAAWAGRFGFGRPTGIDLPGEVDGILPSRTRRTDALNLSIGQGELSVTPLQMARAYAAIARGGGLPRPRIARDEPVEIEPLELRPTTLEAVRKGLYDCTHVRGGTAYDSGLRRFGAAGKTGSAQRHDRQHPHAWFAGYLPHDAPRWVIVVLAEDAKGGGGHIAAPLAAKIAERLTGGPK